LSCFTKLPPDLLRKAMRNLPLGRPVTPPDYATFSNIRFANALSEGPVALLLPIIPAVEDQRVDVQLISIQIGESAT
jgi:hypothetical protein